LAPPRVQVASISQDQAAGVPAAPDRAARRAPAVVRVPAAPDRAATTTAPGVRVQATPDRAARTAAPTAAGFASAVVGARTLRAVVTVGGTGGSVSATSSTR
jgi:hypothetical protein